MGWRKIQNGVKKRIMGKVWRWLELEAWLSSRRTNSDYRVVGMQHHSNTCPPTGGEMKTVKDIRKEYATTLNDEAREAFSRAVVTDYEQWLERELLSVVCEIEDFDE